MNRITQLHYFAAARDHGWDIGDEDTPKQFCEMDLTEEELADIANVDIEFWREEFNWWKERP